MYRDEAKARRELIDTRLKIAGWDVKNLTQRKQTKLQASH